MEKLSEVSRFRAETGISEVAELYALQTVTTDIVRRGAGAERRSQEPDSAVMVALWRAGGETPTSMIARAAAARDSPAQAVVSVVLAPGTGTVALFL